MLHDPRLAGSVPVHAVDRSDGVGCGGNELLREQGIAGERMASEGYGSENPVASNATAAPSAGAHPAKTGTPSARYCVKTVVTGHRRHRGSGCPDR